MTTPSSCKSFFKPYLIYKLRTQSVTFIISTLFNLLTLPLLSAEILTVYIIRSDEAPTIIPDLFYWFAMIVLFGMAITGGARAFRSCVKKDAVDTLTALPLTRREQFIADMLSGYIANVGPLFPCALIAIIISIPANSAYFKFFTAKGIEPVKDLVIAWIFFLAVALFLLYTLSYILSAFTAVCCGKMSSSIIFTAVISGLTMIGGVGIGSYVEQCITGLTRESTGYLNYIPPIGLINFVYNWFYLLSGIDLTRSDKIPTPSAWGIILLILAGAAVTYVSYRVYKNRQPERTGKVIASNAIYKAMCALGVIAVTSVCMTLLYNFRLTWLAALIALGITAVAVLILEAIRGFKKAGVIITGTRCVITLAVCVIALVIVDKTGFFGARYINKAPAEIESIAISSNGNGSHYYNIEASGYRFVEWSGIHIVLDDQDDIKRFLDGHNETLKRYSPKLKTGYDFLMEISLKNGELIRRTYTSNFRSGGYDTEAYDELENNVYSLPGYNSKAVECYISDLSDKENVKAEIKDTFGDVDIPNERLSELIELFTREFEEKYTPSDTTAGIIFYAREKDDKSLKAIDIPSSCTNTLELINTLRGDDSNTTAFTVQITANGANISCPVTVKETQTELGRELVSLLGDTYEQYRPNRSNPICILSTDLNRYYVHKADFDRVFEILMQLIMEK